MSNIPKLRFKEFSGEWEEKKLENFCNKIASGKSKQNNDGQYDLYGSTGIIGKTDQYSNNGKYILIARVGANAGLTNIVEGKFGVTDNTLIVDLNNKAEVDFVLPLLHKYNLNKLIFGSGQPLITGGQLKELKLFFPSIDEQQKIASFLSAVDTKIDQLTRKKELLEQYKKGVMQKIFSQELRFKADDGSEFPEWEEKKLGDVFHSVKGKGISKNKIAENGKYQCVLYGELYTKYNEVIFEVISRTNEEDGIKSKSGDLLIPSSTTTTGIDLANVTALNKDNILIGGDITVLRSKEKTNNIFYAYYLSNHKKDEIASYAQGITIVHLYYGHIKDMVIDLPSIDEQTKIANFLSAIDTKIDLVTKQLDVAKNFKKGLLQQMFV